MLMTTLTLAGLMMTSEAPDMRVNLGGLDPARPAHAAEMADRIRAASRDFCEIHRATVTPDHVDTPLVCEREMRRRVVRALPWEDQLRFVRAGGARALNRPWPRPVRPGASARA